MPKPDFLSPKAISNRMKSKGLQKLKWFCQACQKQCRDENGFKCHCQSEAHQRQMMVFSDKPGFFVSAYSRQFEAGFMAILRRKGTKLVNANTVYAEYISDKQHIHMNATAWPTLTSFVHYLARSGKAEIEEIPSNSIMKRWNIRYIEKNPEKDYRQAAALSVQDAEISAAKQEDNLIKQQLKAAEELKATEELKGEVKNKSSDPAPFAHKGAISFNIEEKAKRCNPPKILKSSLFADNESSAKSHLGVKRKINPIDELLHSTDSSKSKLSTLDQIILENEYRKKKSKR